MEHCGMETRRKDVANDTAEKWKQKIGGVEKWKHEIHISLNSEVVF
jgi:predicted secreted protein